MADLARALPWGDDEAGFVTELQAGSDEAFDWLVTHCHGLVYNLVFGMLGESSDAADVTQEVFLKAFRGIRSFRRGSSLKTWLYRIAIREALNHRRWWWRHCRHERPLEAPPDGSGAAADPAEDGATPYEQFAAHELQTVVRRALLALPACFRGAVILRDLEGLSYEEIAEILDVSCGTVKSRILRGRRALREILEPVLRAGERRTAASAAARSARPAAQDAAFNFTGSTDLTPPWQAESAGGGE